ncbi:MAG TPA: polysaccharide biosynthesis protein, partial [Mariniflexile sp.]|nr:polysaccharide biosynthesis protein [Mariniflexile sp.]
MIHHYFTYLSQKYASKWLVFAIDLITVLVTFCASYLIRFNFSLNFDIKQFLFQLPFVLVVAAVSFLIVGSFKSVIRHTGFTDVVNLFKSVAIMSLFTILFVLLNRELNFIADFTIPLSILVMHALMSFVFLSASRLLFKMTYNHLKCKYVTSKRVLIYGAGDSGIVTYNALISNVRERFDVVGFIDDNHRKNGKAINGISIFHKNKVTQAYVDAHQIDEIIVTSENINKDSLLSLVNLNVKITKVPPIENWINGELNVRQIKQVQIEDLLGRAPIQIDNPNLLNEFYGETVLVTGAAGSIGSELVKQLAQFQVK